VWREREWGGVGVGVEAVGGEGGRGGGAGGGWCGGRGSFGHGLSGQAEGGVEFLGPAGLPTSEFVLGGAGAGMEVVFFAGSQ